MKVKEGSILASGKQIFFEGSDDYFFSPKLFFLSGKLEPLRRYISVSVLDLSYLSMSHSKKGKNGMKKNLFWPA